MRYIKLMSIEIVGIKWTGRESSVGELKTFDVVDNILFIDEGQTFWSCKTLYNEVYDHDVWSLKTEQVFAIDMQKFSKILLRFVIEHIVADFFI